MKITYIIICLLSMVILPVKAQLQQNFNILNMGDGLSDNTITSIIKDSEGFMWFGSSNGLNQYDGKNIRIFKLTNSSNKNINKIISIDKENLLIRSDKKLYVFSKRYERFILLTFPQHENTFIKDFAIDRQKRCWIIHNNGLSVINLDNIDFYSHSDSLNITDRENVSINNSKLDVIYYDTKSDSLFLATNKGEIISINTSNKKYDTICNIPIKMEYSINSIYYNEKQIWIATIDDGIYSYNIENRDIMHWISNNTGHDKLLSHNDVYQILQLNTNQLLALTWNGCTLINNRGNKQFNLQPLNLSNSQYQYGETRMISGYADPDGIIWIGTEGGGYIVL